jgi:ABC-type nitrate/sulfonate/bicarbonate transport system ATPase subunit
MSDPKKDPPGGSGAGPAGGAEVKQSTPARDPAAEAAALAALEAEEKALAEKDEPPGKAAANMAKAKRDEADGNAQTQPIAVDAHSETQRVSTSGNFKMPDLGKALAKPPVVAFDKVTKSFGSFTAIKDVTFAIEDYPGRGEFVSILGPSGCGKSTVIRLIAGLIPQFPQTSGTVLIDGKPIHGPGPDRGMVFQDYTSFDNRSVLENVAFGLECRGLRVAIASDGVVRKQTVTTVTTVAPHDLSKGMRVTLSGVGKDFDGAAEIMNVQTPTTFTIQQPDKKDGKAGGGYAVVPTLSKGEREDRAKHWIEKVGLSVKKDADKYPHQLSGGMRQRVAIARTLILQPRIILMDEPFGALDPPTRTRMQDNLVELWREQSPTIFFITHSVEEAVFLGDHILLFSNSPGTILKQIRVPPPDRPSIQMQRDPKFIETTMGIRETIDHLESSNRAGD